MRNKRVYESKSIAFFIVMIIAVIATGLTKNGDYNGREFADINWEAIITALGGIILRFFSSSKIKM